MPDAPLELRLFGSPTLRLNNQDERVNLKKLLGLTAYLALEGATQRSRLAGLLWSDVDEDSARRNLRRELVRVKTHAAVLEGRFTSEGERLKLTEPWSSDVQDFETALERDDLEKALECYRGVLLDGLEIVGGFQTWLEVKREYYIRLWRKAMLDLAERLETKGDWRRALELHRRLLEEDNLQERSHREVMRLHYLLGEREAALTQFEVCRAMLGGQLGLEPLQETLLLAEQIRGVQTLEPMAMPPVTQALALEIPLVGRDAEFERLCSSSKTVLLLGEAGVGKTRLLTELATLLETVWVRFTESASRAPLAAIAQTIADALKQPVLFERLMQLETRWRLEVVRLVPELDPDLEPVPASDSASRTRFLEGLARALLAIGTCLIFEDVHHTNAMSLELIRMILPKLEGNQRVLLSTRAAELEQNEAGSDLLTQLGWADEIEIINLNPFNHSDVQQLLEHNNLTSDGFVNRLMQATNGNPLFVLESLRYVLERPNLQGTLPVPPTLRNAILERIKRLGNAAKRLLETASLTDDGFNLREVQPATALTDWEGVEGLERAVKAAVLFRLEHGYAFAHDLVKQAIAGNLSSERQAIIHGKLAQTLEGLGATPNRIAYHLEGAGQNLNAAPWRVKAAQLAEKIFAHQDALNQYEQALEDGVDDLAAWEIHQARIQVLTTLMSFEDLQTDLEKLEDIAQRSQNQKLKTQTMLERGKHLENLGKHREALACFDAILETPDLDINSQCLALTWSARCLEGLSVREEAERRLKLALEIVPAQDLKTLVNIRQRLCMLAISRKDYSQATTQINTALAESLAAGKKREHALCLNTAARLALVQGKRSEAVEHLNQAVDEARNIYDISIEYSCLVNLVRVHIEGVQLEAAQQRLEEALALTKSPRDPRTEGTLQHRLGDVHLLRGQLGLAISAFQIAIANADAVAQTDQQRFRRGLLIDLLLQLGDTVKSQVLLEEYAVLVEPENQDTHHGFALARASLELQRGKTEVALAHLEQLLVAEKISSLAEQQELTRYSLGKARLASGDAVGALEISEGLQSSVSSQALTLCLRLRAQVKLGFNPSQELNDVESLLASTRIPPLESLELRVCAAQTLEFLGQHQAALEMRSQAKEILQKLAAALEDFPALQQLFLEKHGELLR